MTENHSKPETGRATPFDRAKLSYGDVRAHVPPEVVEIINRPHDHEGVGNSPIWIIWSVLADAAPQIDTLCDHADSAVYHYGMLAQEIERSPRVKRLAFVERVPANHRFASSVAYLFDGPIAYGKPFQRRSRP